jgi:hypothetical protein
VSRFISVDRLAECSVSIGRKHQKLLLDVPAEDRSNTNQVRQMRTHQTTTERLLFHFYSSPKMGLTPNADALVPFVFVFYPFSSSQKAVALLFETVLVYSTGILQETSNLTRRGDEHNEDKRDEKTTTTG